MFQDPSFYEEKFTYWRHIHENKHSETQQFNAARVRIGQVFNYILMSNTR